MALAYYDDDDHKQKPGLLMSGVSKLMALAIALVAVLFWAMFVTYNPEDPSMLQGNGNSPTNALGYMGAYFADPLIQLLGKAVWVLPLSLAIWAVRIFIGIAQSNFVNRILFVPFTMLAGSIFASTLTPSGSWPFDEMGMGGVFGDKVLGTLLKILPLPYGLSLFILSICLGVMAFLALCYVSGIQMAELFGFGQKIFDDVRYIWGLVFNRHSQETIAQAPRKRDVELQDEMPRSKASRLANVAIPKVAMPQIGGSKEEVLKHSAQVPDAYSDGLNDEKFSPRERVAPAKNVGTLSLSSIFGGRKPESTASDAWDEATHLSGGEYVPTAAAPTGSRLDDIVSRKKAKHEEMLRRHYATALPNEMQGSDDHLMEEFSSFSQSEEVVLGRREPLVKSPSPKPVMSARANLEAQPSFSFEPSEAIVEFEKPSLALLQNPENIVRHVPPREALEASARQLEAVLDDYGVKGEIVAVRPGPVVTMYELEPAAGLKASRVIGLADDIARSMSALTARVATIPGRSVIGIELPNDSREMVLLREIFTAKNYGDTKLSLPLALGKDIAGEPVVANLAKMPHLLIAGTTGSGKSVAINTMILSLLYHARPEDVRMIMIDPKMLELSVYDNIPHLLSPVVTDPKKAVIALKWVVAEMEERYRKMSKMGVRNIDGYNARVKEAIEKGEDFNRTVQTGFDDLTGEPVFETEEYAPETMPYIVVIVDEMADLMMVAGKEIEACIQRLAQMARASGIHLIMATQRPSVDVITGTIKANFPTRISFQVTSKIDSRTILGEMGAEQLLGMGDMLYMSGGGRVTRVHGPFVSDEEVEEVVRHLKAQGEPDYVSAVIDGPEDEKTSDIDAVLGLADSGGEGELYDQAVAIVARDRKCSTSYIQRKLSIGYNKAANLVERMEDEGVVSSANHVGKREVLVAEI